MATFLHHYNYVRTQCSLLLKRWKPYVCMGQRHMNLSFCICMWSRVHVCLLDCYRDVCPKSCFSLAETANERSSFVDAQIHLYIHTWKVVYKSCYLLTYIAIFSYISIRWAIFACFDTILLFILFRSDNFLFFHWFFGNFLFTIIQIKRIRIRKPIHMF